MLCRRSCDELALAPGGQSIAVLGADGLVRKDDGPAESCGGPEMTGSDTVCCIEGCGGCGAM